MPSKQTRSNQDLWALFTTAAHELRASIEPTKKNAIGVSVAETYVLEALDRLGGDGIRQSELSLALGWQKSRLSHQLSRMQGRGLLSRRALSPSAAEVSLRPIGVRALAQSKVTRASAVRKHLIEALTAHDRRVLRRILVRLTDHQLERRREA